MRPLFIALIAALTFAATAEAREIILKSNQLDGKVHVRKGWPDGGSATSNSFAGQGVLTMFSDSRRSWATFCAHPKEGVEVSGITYRNCEWTAGYTLSYHEAKNVEAVMRGPGKFSLRLDIDMSRKFRRDAATVPFDSTIRQIFY